MHYAMLADIKWQTCGKRGARKCELWRGGENACTTAYKFAKGVSFPAHHHPGWEQLVVVSGRWQIDDRVLEPGDVAITAPNQAHEERALEDTVVIISVGNNDIATPARRSRRRVRAG